MTNTFSQQEINTIFARIQQKFLGKKVKIERNENRIEVYKKISPRRTVQFYAKKKIHCSGFDQESQIEMRVSSMCSAVTLTKKMYGQIDENLNKAVLLFNEEVKRQREEHKKETADSRAQAQFYKALKTTKLGKYDKQFKTSFGKVEGYVSVEKGNVNISFRHMEPAKAYKLISLVTA